MKSKRDLAGTIMSLCRARVRQYDGGAHGHARHTIYIYIYIRVNPRARTRCIIIAGNCAHIPRAAARFVNVTPEETTPLIIFRARSETAFRVFVVAAATALTTHMTRSSFSSGPGLHGNT